MARFVGRENVRKRLAPLAGEPGRTIYAEGAVRIELPAETIVVRPPFGLAHARALIEEAAEVAVAVLQPWRVRVEHVALGGDRDVVNQVLAARPQLAWLVERALPRFFAVPDPRLRVLERLPYDLYAAELASEPG